MKTLKYISILSGLVFTLLLTSCEPEFNNPVDAQGLYSSGEADLSNYVAVGNSLTAGYADGALYLAGQKNSYPNIMAQQFALAGGGDFTQPLMNDNYGGLTLGGQQITSNRLVLRMDANGQRPVTLEGTATTDISNKLSGPFNNMGVPGAKTYHLLAKGYGDIANFPAAANPYFIRMASTSGASVIEDVVAQDPSFFSLWIGNNDVLGYATSGGSGIDQQGNLNPATYTTNDITDTNVFAASVNQILMALTTNGAKGAMANLPTATIAPYFTTVPYNAIPLDAQTAALLNQNFAPYNQAVAAFLPAEEAAKRTISFKAGQNPVLILDKDLTDLSSFNPALTKMRQATAADYITLPTSSLLGTLADPSNPLSVIGVAVPLTDEQVLTESEAALVAQKTATYNAILQNLAAQYDIAFIDVNTTANNIHLNGLPFDGGILTTAYGSGGVFSLDGIHFTARGYSLVANAFIEAINQKYGATIPEVNPGTYPTIYVE